MNIKPTRIFITMSITLFAVGFLIILTFTFIQPFNDWSFYPDSELFSQYGSFVGGIAGSLISIGAGILLYITLVETRKSSNLQSFENSFFNLLNIQNELLNSISIKTIHNDSDYVLKSREFFRYSLKEIDQIYEAIDHEVYVKPGRVPDLLDDLELGEGNHGGMYILNKKGETKYHISKINKKYGITEELWTKSNPIKIKEKIRASYAIYFQYYHFALGHYFRHLYHIVKFVSNAEILKDNNLKSKYFGFIQAQMSSYELALTYYNITCFPKMYKLVKDSKLLENMNISDLVRDEHYCLEGITLKDKKYLLDFLDE